MRGVNNYLPKYRMKDSPENDRWIREQILKLSHAKRAPTIEKYNEIYRNAGFSEKVKHARTCTATRAANSWLREFVNNQISKPGIKP